jgi:protein-disulfide isomerase
MDTKPAKHSEEEVITINIQPYITPISILLSAIIVASSILIGLNNVATAFRGGSTTTTATTGTTTTGTTTTPTGAVTVTKEQITALFNDSNNIRLGDANRKVLFVEFSDPSCPYCHIATGNNPELNRSAGASFILASDGGTYVAPVAEFKKLVNEGKASYVWKYTNGHGNGEMGSKAMYCANEQGRFWEVHDLLYTNAGYNLLNNTVKNDKAQSGALADFLAPAIDKNFMKSCLESGKYDSRLATDQSEGAALGVSGTPGFFVNTTNFAGAYSFTDMKSVVDAALAN